MFLFATSSNINSDGFFSVAYFVTFSHCSPVEYVRLTPTLGVECALYRGLHLGLTQSFDSGTSQYFLLLPEGFQTLRFCHCSFFFFHVHTSLHVILLPFYQETRYLFNTNRSCVRHSGYCASYSTSNTVSALETLPFSLPCCCTT